MPIPLLRGIGYNAYVDFFAEFQKLSEKSPRLSLRVTHAENCEYNNFCHFSRDCYMTFGTANNEHCYYAITMLDCRDCTDCNTVKNCELCYECIDCDNCYNGDFLQDCKQVRDSAFCFDCVGCENCFGCAGLRNKKYMLWNEQLDKETYEKRLREYATPAGREEARRKFEELLLATPRVYSRQINCENVIGDHCVNSKNCLVCFDAKEAEDCLYQDRPLGAKDCVDCSNLYQNCELNYMVMSAIQSVNCNFCFVIDFCHDCEYSMLCFNSHHLFGCIARNHAEYEILNVKYSPEEWHARVAEIKEQMRREGSYGTMFESDFPAEDSIVGDYLDTSTSS